MQHVLWKSNQSVGAQHISDAKTLQWRHKERDGVWNHRCIDCLPNRLFRRRSKTISKLRVTGEGNPLVTGGFPSQTASNGEYFFSFADVIMPVIKSITGHTSSTHSALKNMQTTLRCILLKDPGFQRTTLALWSGADRRSPIYGRF